MPTFMKDAGHKVINLALDDDDFDIAVRTAQAEYDQYQPGVIIGSSRGGAVAVNIKSEDHSSLIDDPVDGGLCQKFQRCAE